MAIGLANRGKLASRRTLGAALGLVAGIAGAPGTCAAALVGLWSESIGLLILVLVVLVAAAAVARATRNGALVTMWSMTLWLLLSGVGFLLTLALVSALSPVGDIAAQVLGVFALVVQWPALAILVVETSSRYLGRKT